MLLARDGDRAVIDTLTSELKTGERTRLAVELHDSLAQNLTGVAMEIEAAIRSGGDGASPHLTIADKALKSCRTELRNALWDLRNQALEEPVMKDAIRRCRRFRGSGRSQKDELRNHLLEADAIPMA